MTTSYDIDFTGDQAKAAIRAIIARINGVFDDPDLIAVGPLSTDTSADVLRIAESVDTTPEHDDE